MAFVLSKQWEWKSIRLPYLVRYSPPPSFFLVLLFLVGKPIGNYYLLSEASEAFRYRFLYLRYRFRYLSYSFVFIQILGFKVGTKVSQNPVLSSFVAIFFEILPLFTFPVCVVVVRWKCRAPLYPFKNGIRCPFQHWSHVLLEGSREITVHLSPLSPLSLQPICSPPPFFHPLALCSP